ncbi:MAG: peroxiredoxin family protein [Thermoleophilaceae bacterium]
MGSRAVHKRRMAQERARREAERERAKRLRRLQLQVAGVVGAAIAALAVVFVLNSTGGSSAGDSRAGGGGKAGEFAFAVGDPGPGETAPTFRLPSTGGGTFDLAKQRGRRVLLYFQEGIMCQPCWDQIVDLEKQEAKLRALGIDAMVSITTDPLDQLEQKQADDGFSTAVLSDPDLRVSVAYSANQYGMMGTSRDGHSFIVVGPDGRIEYRADYGGPPDHTMYVPPENLIADIRKGMRESS